MNHRIELARALNKRIALNAPQRKQLRALAKWEQKKLGRAIIYGNTQVKIQVTENRIFRPRMTPIYICGVSVEGIDWRASFHDWPRPTIEH